MKNVVVRKHDRPVKILLIVAARLCHELGRSHVNATLYSRVVCTHICRSHTNLMSHIFVYGHILVSLFSSPFPSNPTNFSIRMIAVKFIAFIASTLRVEAQKFVI